MSNKGIARQLSFAFVQANDVWVSLHGATPHQVTHLNLSRQQLYWQLTWSADQTRLLATESNPLASGGFQGESWLISLPALQITPLPTQTSLTEGCTLSCGWIGDRYLVHADLSKAGSHAQPYHIYDTQAQRDIATSLDTQVITEWEVRDSELYFTPYIDSIGNGRFVPGTIKRFDLASNQITTAFTVSEGALVSEGISSAHWDISADGHEIVYYFFAGALHDCPADVHCMTIYQDTTGRITAIFRPYQLGANVTTQIDAPVWISPNGSIAAGFITGGGASAGGGPLDTLVQQALPSGNGWSNALPAGDSPHSDWVLGWLAQPAEVVIQRVEQDTQGTPLATSIYVAPAGSNGAHLVETIQAGQVAFAPLG